MNLRNFEIVVINSSGGKDSQAMTDYVVAIAREQNVLPRLLMVHCDLGRMEWNGTRELVTDHAKHYQIPLFIVRREKGNLLDQVRARRKWPDSQNRYCTSDQKRDQVAKLHTKLSRTACISSPARILNCMGFRKDESPARAKRPALEIDRRTSNGRKTVWNWLPIHDWSVTQVWDRIRASGVRHHYAYDLGMPRLSCVFCIFAPEAALRIAARHNPDLFTEYVEVEKEIGHDFRHGFKLANLSRAGVTPT